MDIINQLKLPESQNVLILHNEELELKKVILYEVLGEVDVLLTDYSSVFIDFMNLDKPIAFVFDDIECYGQSRGFNFNNPVEYLPGEKITNYKELSNYLKNMDEINIRWKQKRNDVSVMFNQFMDDGASERVIKEIFG